MAGWSDRGERVQGTRGRGVVDPTPTDVATGTRTTGVCERGGGGRPSGSNFQDWSRGRGCVGMRDSVVSLDDGC